MRRPGMHRERKVLVHDFDAIAVLGKDLLHERLMHTLAERALQVVVIDDRDLGLRIAAYRPAGDIDLAHALGVDVLGEVHLGDLRQDFAVLGKQEIHLLLMTFATECDGHQIVGREVAGMAWSDVDFHVGRKIVLGLNLALDADLRLR